jgi:uncharacterized protein involved in outer membrane biogenesis
MRLKRLAASALLIAALAAVAIGVHFLAPAWLAASLAASVKANTGRELGFGEVGGRLLPQPALVFSDLRLGNAAWGSQPWMALAARVSVDIDAFALLSGRLRIKNIEVADASVLLETDRDGNGNWKMGSAPASVPGWLGALELDQFSLDTLALAYRDGATGNTKSVRVDAARIAAPSASRPMRISLRASFDGKGAAAAGTIGPLAALIANAPGYPVDIEAEVDALRVSVHGDIDQPRRLGKFNLALRAQAPELAPVAALFGATLPPLGAFRGTARLTGAVAAPVLSGIDVEVGTPETMGLSARGELEGSVSENGSYQWRSAGVDVVVQGAQFGDLAGWLGKRLPPLGRYRIAAHVAGAMDAPALSALEAVVGGQEMAEIKLRGSVADLRAASGIDLSLEATADKWWRLGAAADAPRLPPFRASARLRDTAQGYRVDDLKLNIADSSVSAALQVVRARPRLQVTGKVQSPLIDLARLAQESRRAAASAAAPAAPRPTDYWKLADFDLALKIGRLVLPDGRQLRSGSGRVSLDNGRLKLSALQLALGGAKVKLEGSIADPQRRAGVDLGIALRGDELGELFRFFGRSIEPVGPYKGRARLHGSLDALAITGIDADAGRSGQNVHVSGQIADAIARRGIQLALAANVGDSAAAGRLFGVALPRLPPLRATAQLSAAHGGYALDDLRLALGRSSVRGRVAYAPAAPRPQVTANLRGSLLDLSELQWQRPKAGGPNPLLAADVQAEIHIDRVVLPSRRALGPVSGALRLTAGALELQQFSIAVDGASATFDGRINKPLTPAALDLMVTARLTDGAGLSALTGMPLKELPAFAASGRLTDLPNGYALAGLKLASAAMTLSGDLAVTRGAERFRVSAKARSPLLDLSAFARPAAAARATEPASAAARAIPDLPLPLKFLRAVDADVDLRFDRVKLADAPPMGPLLLHATIADGLLRVEPAQLAILAGQTLGASLTADAARSAWTLRIEGVGIDLGEALARIGGPGLVTGGSTDLALQVRGSGESSTAILGSLDGEVRVEVGPHRIHNFAVEPDTSIVLRVFELANPSHDTDRDTDVRCLVAKVPIRDGVLAFRRNVAVETAKYNAVASGTVNLRTEAVDVAVTPIVKDGSAVDIGNVSVIVQLRGTLAAPKVGVNPVDVALKSAASLGAAAATLGGSWLADTLLRSVTSDPHPCATALAQ